MSRGLLVHRAGPGVSVQDLGRPGYLRYGVSQGGAADRIALAEGAALLGQETQCAALEMPGTGGVFEASKDLRIALTGARMRATIDGATAAWNASHLLPAGATLSVGAAEVGVYGYLSVAGGFETAVFLESRSAHFAAGIGRAVSAGETLPIGGDAGGKTGMTLPADDRFGGSTVRVVPSAQTHLFTEDARSRFEATTFTRDARGNRMGVRVVPDGDGFQTDSGLSIVSEVITPGDIQVTGDGTPFVLLAECQTTGGYPRMGSVLPSDLPRVAQTAAGETLRFQFVTLEEAVALEANAREALAQRLRGVTPLIRDPRMMPDLLSYQLIGGVTDGTTFVDGTF